MNIEKILLSKYFTLKPTTKWIAVEDQRQTFKDVFGTSRFGKLQGTGLYVTIERLKAECEELIIAYGLTLCHVRSTKGDGRLYPGFDAVGASDGAVAQCIDALCALVDRHL